MNLQPVARRATSDGGFVSLNFLGTGSCEIVVVAVAGRTTGSVVQGLYARMTNTDFKKKIRHEPLIDADKR